MSRGAVAAATGFVVVDSVVTGTLLLGMNVLRAWFSKPGMEGFGHSVPFSFSVGSHLRAKRD